MHMNPVLTFAGYHRDDYFTLDNVTIAAIPEPGIVPLFGVGLLAVLHFCRRRQTAN